MGGRFPPESVAGLVWNRHYAESRMLTESSRTTTVRTMIQRNILNASQIVPCAPWQVRVDELESEVVRKSVSDIRNRVRAPQTPAIDDQSSLFS